jgi:hypothetical protein
MVGRTPTSAADAPVGLLRADAADFVGEKRVQGTRADQGVRPTICALRYQTRAVQTTVVLNWPSAAEELPRDTGAYLK